MGSIITIKTLSALNPTRLLLLLFLLNTPTQCFASIGSHSLHFRLTQQIELILNNTLEYEKKEYYIVKLDKHSKTLNIPDCRGQWRFTLPVKIEGNITIRLNCDAFNSWEMYIPISIQHRIAPIVA
ncbi:hypothetical protein EDC56_0806 [Sinobacterium caligoides]|uniref:Uncharacterized protein n=1 Tax=Sinobacterium caligoides TaxID=933926 RepID=A0A3N2DZH9_9GAMM|nr:hypothetical protein [Sinobacterium caligoides]ROS05276.1 hypothetical protein EDC56_0806 [Sinobacterium caligoides]